MKIRQEETDLKQTFIMILVTLSIESSLVRCAPFSGESFVLFCKTILSAPHPSRAEHPTRIDRIYDRHLDKAIMTLI
jgi:hypothetical protein